LDFLDDLEEKDEVADLLNWWNWYVFLTIVFVGLALKAHIHSF